MNTISIKGIDKAVLLAALYNASKQQGMGFADRSGEAPMTTDDAEKEIKENPNMYFDYVRGRVLKVDLSGEALRTSLYDRDSGKGAAQRVVDSIKNAEQTTEGV